MGRVQWELWVRLKGTEQERKRGREGVQTKELLFTFFCPTLKYKSHCIMSNNNHLHSPALTIRQVLFFNNSEVGIVIRRSREVETHGQSHRAGKW